MIFNNKFRLIISHNLSAKVNSNIDNALFKNFKDNDLPILRIYSWQDSVTFGAGQDPQDYKNLIEDYKNNYSKRITGGGVLFHGHDISYSLIVPSKMIEDKNVKETYELICKFVLAFYENLDFKASFAKDIKEITLSKSNFCQVGFEAYDIIIDGQKIGGNAQKRAKKVIFQHGSIPIKNVKNDKKYGSSLESFGVKLDFKEAIEKLKIAFTKTFNSEFINSELNEDELKIYNELCKE
ncbi:lipoate--protein ligase family protein [Aliarcobacter vitoriensis]|uniref:Ligase n=1 Tax=Aliarcobacter vitoriensis TaxID=2011099 RepID=A0A366MSH3_9BACT|nr:lipoate--protein ligase family protein [Aliarcobacter vitoriensis]RBQ28282.1 ligase [Aliarcobacter vitoriensis]